MGKSTIKDERLPIVKELFISGTKYPPEEDMAHYNSCDGCYRCDYMMEFFSHCYCCNVVVDKMELYYDHPGGDYYCEDCVGGMPDYNTNEFVLCGNCCKRDIRENMVQYHENFHNNWTCDKCVTKSIISNRFEIMDL